MNRSGCRALGIVLWAIACVGGAARASFVEQIQFGTGSTIAVAWGDADGDGDLDLAVGRSIGGNSLYLNNGDGTYTAQAQFGGGATFVVLWADFDNDGDQDMAVGRSNNQQNYLFVNNGDGTFTQQNQFGLLRTIALAWADSDLDGDLDLAVGNGILGTNQQNYLYLNNGDGSFTAQAQFGQSQTDAVVWGDFDNDGDPDLAVGNGGFGTVQQNFLYVNNGNGTFTERAEFGTGDTAALAWGDADNDGDLDLAVGNWNATQCFLYRNNGDGSFAGEPQFGARDTNTLNWGDADNDGDLDLAVGNGDFTSADQNYLYVNNGDGTFTEQGEFGLGSTDAVAWGDADRDGDLDLAAGNEHTPAQNYLYVNQATNPTYLDLRLVGHRHDFGPGHSNRDAIGAKVAVYEAGFLGQSGHLLGYREVEAHGGFSAQSQRNPHFGLPGRTLVDVRITWPGSGGSHRVQDLTDVAVGQTLTVDEPQSMGIPGSPRGGRATMLQISPNPTTGEVRISVAVGEGAGVSGGVNAGARTGVGTGAGGDTSLPVRYAIFDAGGRRLRVLSVQSTVGGAQPTLSWDGRAEDGRSAAPGIYLVRALDGADDLVGRIVRIE